jgi:hypothetical protein
MKNRKIATLEVPLSRTEEFRADTLLVQLPEYLTREEAETVVGLFISNGTLMDVVYETINPRYKGKSKDPVAKWFAIVTSGARPKDLSARATFRSEKEAVKAWKRVMGGSIYRESAHIYGYSTREQARDATFTDDFFLVDRKLK